MRSLFARSLFSTTLVLSLLPLASACGSPPEPETPASAPAQAPQQILPLRSLRLYETGVGYFERSGSVGGRIATSLPVPAGHLDDALASLVVLNAGQGGHVTGVSFASSVTRATARARAGLPPDPATPVTFRDLLESLKGEKVTIAARGENEHVTGRIVEVTTEVDQALVHVLAANKEAKPDPNPPKHLVVTVMSDRGAITPVDADDIVRIRPVDPEFAARIDAALDALGTRSAQNARALSLLGDAKGPVTFGYIAEAPIWRASYRLILDARADKSASQAELQGWALLHNDTDESWRDVHLELVNGQPDSFLFPMAAPRYARRELIHPEEPLSTLPQLQSTTADAMWGDHLDGHGSGTGTGEGYGYGHGRLGGSHSVKSPALRQGMTQVSGEHDSSLLEVGNLADLAQAGGTEQGALFVYSVPSGFSLDAHASALVPFVQKKVDVESIAFFSSAGTTARSAVRFVNGTGQTLPTGTISVFSGGGFSGEASIDRLKPGERRFLLIGNDLDSEVTEKKANRREESKRLTFDNDRLEEHFLRTTEYGWDVENRSGASRTFYVALGINKNAKVTGADKLDFDEATSRAMVVLDTKAKSKATRNFTVVEGLSRSTFLDGITEKLARSVLTRTTIPAVDLGVLQQALPKIQALELALAQVNGADKAIATADQDLERLREDLKALGGAGNAAAGGGAAAAPLVKRVVDAEDRVAAARKNKEAAEKTLDEKREALRQALGKLAAQAQ
jgi:hypothetical protein